MSAGSPLASDLDRLDDQHRRGDDEVAAERIHPDGAGAQRAQ
jgi:hypothetical protein